MSMMKMLVLVAMSLMSMMIHSEYRGCLGVLVCNVSPSGLCFAGMLIRFHSGIFQALDMSCFSKGHADFFSWILAWLVLQCRTYRFLVICQNGNSMIFWQNIGHFFYVIARYVAKCLWILFSELSICSRHRRCLSRILVVDSTEEAYLIRGAMSRTGLRRAGTGRCYLSGGVAWWGASPLLTQTFFGGGRVVQWRCGGLRTLRRWYVTVSARRTSTSVVTEGNMP